MKCKLNRLSRVFVFLLRDVSADHKREEAENDCNRESCEECAGPHRLTLVERISSVLDTSSLLL